MAAESHMIRLQSGLALHALTAGEGGTPLVMIPGWSQTAALFDRNIDALAAGRRVVALDMRGHGGSEKPAGGYRVSRLAKDLAEALAALGLERVDLLGHSMGSSVIWSYLDLFGDAAVRRVVIVDQAPTATALPTFDEAERRRCGCLFPDHAALLAFCAAVRAAPTAEATAEILRGMFTSGVPAADLAHVAAENVKFPRDHAATLVYDHCLADWRDVIVASRLPTLVIGGEASFFHPDSQRWIASMNPYARASIFGAGEGGSHFMFFENPQRFNAEVAAFLAA